jgi:hypothetical protein
LHRKYRVVAWSRIRNFQGTPFGSRVTVKIYGHPGTGAIFSQNHQRRIDCNSCEPRGEPGAPVKLMEMEEGFEHRVLEGVFRVLLVSSNASYYAKKLCRMPLAEFSKGVLIPRGCG